MDVNKIIVELESKSDNKVKNNLTKLGIPSENSLGVSTSEIRKMAKMYKRDDDFAKRIWDTGVHEMKLLAVLLMDPKKCTDTKVDYYMSTIYSWDLCDHFCKNYLIKCSNYKRFIDDWVCSNKLYYKRAGFTLIASQAINDKNIDEEELNKYFEYIEQFSDDDRVHVYKSISWALRELGKVNLEFQEKAIIVAHNLCEGSNTTKNKIGKMSLKELENLVKVPERKRLISRSSKMGLKKE